MRIKDNGNGFAIWLSARDTYDWAHRPGKAWPCSQLSGYAVFAEFDRNGLLDFGVKYDGRPVHGFDVDANEFNAMVADLAATKVGKDNQAWFVAIGQFLDGQTV